MKYLIGISVATIILAAILWTTLLATLNTNPASIDLESGEAESATDILVAGSTGASAEWTADPENRERRQEADASVGLFGRVSPAEIEGAIFQRIAEQVGLELVSLSSVECDMRRCSVVFSGVDSNPQHVGDYSELTSALTDPPWAHFRPASSSLSTREVSPGAREYVIGITYIAVVDTSDNPEIAARQDAACAGAWARVTQLRGSSEYIRGAHEQAAEWLERSAAVLGLEEAQRLADELPFGPLTRDCHATPY